jgi:hypothetical protein
MPAQVYHQVALTFASSVIAARIFSMILFAWYGGTCLFTKKMVGEFERYGVPGLRVLTGTLQVAASLGLLLGGLMLGPYSRPLLLFSSAGLSVMMFFAVMTRIRIRDPFHEAIPALALCVLNLFVFVSAL